MEKGHRAMNQRRRHVATNATAAIVLGLMALVLALGLLASPANAQVNDTTTTSTTTTTVATTTPTVGSITYPITRSSVGTTTTTEPTTTTTTAKHGGLAFTGADITVTVGAAAVALGAGGMLVLASRKRKAAR